jgi:hypothetical protein
MTSGVGVRAQQVTHSDCDIPPPPSGQHAAPVVQAIVPSIGMPRAIAALPKASETSASRIRNRAIMPGNTGVVGREVKRAGIALLRRSLPKGYRWESSDLFCRPIERA